MKTKVILNPREGEEKRCFEEISRAPHQISRYRRLARILSKRKRPEEAALVLKMALRRLSEEQFREKKELTKQLARTYEDGGDLPRAIRIYRKLIRKYPEDFAPYERLEKIYRRRGEEKEIIRILQGVGKYNPRRERALKHLVNLEKDQNKLKAARRYLKKLIEEFGGDFARLKEMGRLYEKCGQLHHAVRFYNKAAKLRPDNADIFLIIGICQRKNGQLTRARRTFEKILKFKPGFYGAHIQLAEIDIEEGAFLAAEKHLRKLDSRWPGNSRVQLNRAHILLKQGKAQAALDLARENSRSTPFYYTDELSLGHTVLAEAHRELGKEREYRYHSLMADRIRGSSDFFKTAIAVIDELIIGTDLEMARQITDGLLERFPGNSLASLKKAQICRMEGNLEEAITLAERASRESNPRYLQDKIRGLKLVSELYEDKGLCAKARQTRELAGQLSARDKG